MPKDSSALGTTPLQAQLDLVHWEAVMAAPRRAGGHLGVLTTLFRGATPFAGWREDDCQGTVLMAYLLADGRYVVLSDSFGSCSGCDAREDANDESARRMVHALATNAHCFPTLEALTAFLAADVPAEPGTYYHLRKGAVALGVSIRRNQPTLEGMRTLERLTGWRAPVSLEPGRGADLDLGIAAPWDAMRIHGETFLTWVGRLADPVVQAAGLPPAALEPFLSHTDATIRATAVTHLIQLVRGPAVASTFSGTQPERPAGRGRDGRLR